MPRPFLELTLDQFSDLLVRFPWRRRITEVHMHHTFRPNHADFAARPPVQSIEGMFRFHTETRGFSDIAQHVTIDPRGRIWTGRNFNAPPASATGFNGNATAGPFMFEMIGDFDRERDRWDGDQRKAAIEVIARVQKLFGLPPEALRFHQEMSAKTCPGSAIRKADVVAAVRVAHERAPAVRPQRRGAFDASASRERAATDRLLQLFDVDVRVRAERDEGELPEAAMTLREGAMSAAEPGAFEAARSGDMRDLSPEDHLLLRRHVVNLRMGALSTGGAFTTSEEDVAAIFAEHLPAFLAARRDQGAPLKLVFFAHGGLNDEIESLKNARNRIPFYVTNRCYPIFFIWETGAGETLVDVLRQIAGLGPSRGPLDTFTNLTDAGLERAFRGAGSSLWANMKRSAELAFLERQGGTFLVQQLADFWQQHSAEMEIHTIGHSAGSIFHAYFIDRLCRQPSNPPIEVRSVQFLAPAITVDLFKRLLLPLVGGRVQRLTQFTMLRDFEKADAVGPYRKSLLYLVSRSFEDAPETPLLGLEESVRRDPDLVRFFGLLGNKKGKGEVLFSVQDAGPSQSTVAKKHGDFDNDHRTMEGVIRRVLDVADDVPIVPFPETVSRTALDAPPAASRPPAAAVPATLGPAAPAVAAAGAGRRRALCIGIDAYESPHELAGCVNDARDWAAALRGVGFEVTMVTDRAATWTAITDALAGLVASSQSGDVLVFQYAGHGTLVPDVDGDETEGQDSALCPVDFAAGSFLIDDDVRRILQDLPAGVNLTCFFDCCHSGTITRLAAASRPRAAGDVRIRGLRATPRMEAAHRQFRSGLGVAAPPRRRGPHDMKEISFTACTDAQTAQEIDGHGVYTSRALGVFGRGLAGLTNESFYRQVLTAFGDGAATQTPQLDCAPAAAQRPFLATVGAAAPAPVPAAVDLQHVLERLNEIDRRLAALGA